MSNLISKQEMLDTLNSYKDSSYYNRDRFGVYLDGKPIFFGGVNVFASPGIAKKRIVDATITRHCTKAERNYANKVIEQLINDGDLEIRKL